jgi:hypothetical protein
MLGRNRKKGDTEEKTPGRSRIEVLDAEYSDGEEISEKKDKKLSPESCSCFSYTTIVENV